MRSIVRLILLLLVATGAGAAPQDKAQQKCIQGFEKGAARLSKASGRLALRCVQDAAKKGASVVSCLETDPTGKERKAETKLGESEQKLCAEFPADFGTSDASTAGDGILASRDAWLRDLLTPDLDAGAATEPDAARCQAEAAKRLGKLQEAHWKSALTGAREALKDGAASAVEYEDAVLARLLGDAKIARAEQKLRAKVGPRCDGVDWGDVVPGLCFFAQDVPGCMVASAACEFCSAWNSTTDGTLDCELYDDGEDNGTCRNAAGGPALYVSTTGSDGAEGTREAPLASLAEALGRAAADDYGSIRIAAGVYTTPAADLADGVKVTGGFDPESWAAGGGETVLVGTDPTVLTAASLELPTTLASLTIEAADAGTGDGSYGILVRNTASLRVVDSIVRAGLGGDGSPGASGNDRGDADDGDDGVDCSDGNCNVPTSGGAGGSGSCGDSAAGGGPGGNGGDIPTPLLFDGNGQDGFDSADGTSGGGDGGDECFAIWPDSCVAGIGGRGDDGDDGNLVTEPGPGGSGGTATAAGWFGTRGGQGRAGESGSGGGGGGGGGGKAHQPLIVLESGVGGGGGGAGGCGGGAGTGGDGGGASVALWIWESDVTIEDSTLESRSGGNGGNGGVGGDGGQGGTGGDGGESDDGGDGGRGGNGGDGSAGTSGGGGAGGISFAAYVAGGSLTEIGDNLLLSGSGGSGGNPGGVEGDAGLVGP